MSDESGSDGSDDGPDGWSSEWESAADRTTDVENETADGDGDVASEDEDDYEPSIAGVFGARPEDAPPRPDIVPESPSLENVLFVLLGVLFGVFVIYRAVVVFTA